MLHAVVNFQALIVGDTPSEDVTSASAAALMSKIPPQHFCSTVLRLISLHVISFGEGYSLENVFGGQAMFASQTRTENTLLNLLIPLFLRIGTGRKGKGASFEETTSKIICIVSNPCIDACRCTEAETVGHQFRFNGSTQHTLAAGREDSAIDSANLEDHYGHENRQSNVCRAGSENFDENVVNVISSSVFR